MSFSTQDTPPPPSGCSGVPAGRGLSAFYADLSLLLAFVSFPFMCLSLRGLMVGRGEAVPNRPVLLCDPVLTTWDETWVAWECCLWAQVGWVGG